jgi:hypothetical protein
MAEAPALHGSTALWALAPVRSEARLQLVPTAPRSTSVPSPRPASSFMRSASVQSDASRTSTQRSAARALTLTRRGRLLLVGLPIALGVAALILLGAFLTSQAKAGESTPATSSTVEVSVASGETLWDLAVQYAPERDPRDVVAEIVELNDLHTSLVRAGQSIAVPAGR